jgi:integrase
LKRVGLKRPKLGFHSLRHTFAAELKRRAPTEMENRERLLGHTLKGVAGSYGSTFESEAHDMFMLEHRAKIVALLSFDQARSASP